MIWDMRGHGRSCYPDEPAVYSEAHIVADMAAILDRVVGEGKSAIVGGSSLGGYMSQAFYHAHPERVESLLLIDTGPGFKSDKAREAWNKTTHKTADRLDREDLEVLQGASPERSRERSKHRNAEGLAMARRAMLTQRSNGVVTKLPDIKVPALVVVGSDDKPVLGASEYMRLKIPGCQKVVIPDAGHAANIDQPQAFNKAVLDFLASVKGRVDSNQRSKL